MTEGSALVMADAAQTLRWYAAQAKELARAWARPDGMEATIKAAMPLANDGGRRAEEALAQRETDKD
jgi:hypothetical protein